MCAKLQVPRAPRLTAEISEEASEALALRERVFRGGAPDRDDQDDRCRHLVVRDRGRAVACLRLRRFAAGEDLNSAYAARFYDLDGLPDGLRFEIGRFCTDPAAADPAVLRLALGVLRSETAGAALLFGCSSLPGGAADHRAALAALAPHARPMRRKAAETLDLSQAGADPARLPPLLRMYLALGAEVSDHAVLDRDLDTLHVLTLLDPARVPPALASALRPA